VSSGKLDFKTGNGKKSPILAFRRTIQYGCLLSHYFATAMAFDCSFNYTRSFGMFGNIIAKRRTLLSKLPE
jgi:hypothetical protein